MCTDFILLHFILVLRDCILRFIKQCTTCTVHCCAPYTTVHCTIQLYRLLYSVRFYPELVSKKQTFRTFFSYYLKESVAGLGRHIALKDSIKAINSATHIKVSLRRTSRILEQTPHYCCTTKTTFLFPFRNTYIIFLHYTYFTQKNLSNYFL